MRRVRAASRATPDRRGLAGFITRPLVAVQADSQSRAPVSCSGEKNSTGAVPQIRAREHQRFASPPLVADDGDPLDRGAVADVERQVAPVVVSAPSPRRRRGRTAAGRDRPGPSRPGARPGTARTRWRGGSPAPRRGRRCRARDARSSAWLAPHDRNTAGTMPARPEAPPRPERAFLADSPSLDGQPAPAGPGTRLRAGGDPP